MRGAVELRTDGCTDLQLDSSKHYIVTKWYGSSLAIFEEAAFHQYLRRLDTDFKDNGHGQSNRRDGGSLRNCWNALRKRTKAWNTGSVRSTAVTGTVCLFL